MKKNPIIPFALIAVLGILAMIIFSVIGLNEQDKIASDGEESSEESTIREDPEAIVQSCIGCHGGDLEGATGPSLQNIGSKYNQEEIYEIIVNGIEGTGMPSGVVPNEEAEILSKWLAEKK
ncbi:cytochrome c551 [Gracilibacillus boraciitolerans JCM 21714]|uniref:Cytochrome c551 n=1 Tax=Gracilibacillus boraciitolerans JCM 21714 TaxID=1298598 RepID=W4VED1_9BACI|nr:cytochrome c [Gracilibacillus boraciitolerans]GAE91173.1 cytochrome c551 [Gracilibacillus boraciitolerans JCM 21714]